MVSYFRDQLTQRTYLHPLVTLQRRALRIVSGSSYPAHTEPRYKTKYSTI